MALYFMRLEWDERRDFFPASVAALTLNAARAKPTDPVYDAHDFLKTRYPEHRVSVSTTHDPDRGALGDWRALKGILKGR